MYKLALLPLLAAVVHTAPIPASACTTVLANFTLVGPSLETYAGAFDPASCCSLCQDFEGCAAFIVNSSGCALKADTSGLTPMSGSTTGTNSLPPAEIEIALDSLPSGRVTTGELDSWSSTLT